MNDGFKAQQTSLIIVTVQSIKCCNYVGRRLSLVPSQILLSITCPGCQWLTQNSNHINKRIELFGANTPLTRANTWKAPGRSELALPLTASSAVSSSSRGSHLSPSTEEEATSLLADCWEHMQAWLFPTLVQRQGAGGSSRTAEQRWSKEAGLPSNSLQQRGGIKTGKGNGYKLHLLVWGNSSPSICFSSCFH